MSRARVAQFAQEKLQELGAPAIERHLLRQEKWLKFVEERIDDYAARTAGADVPLLELIVSNADDQELSFAVVKSVECELTAEWNHPLHWVFGGRELALSVLIEVHQEILCVTPEAAVVPNGRLISPYVDATYLSARVERGCLLIELDMEARRCFAIREINFGRVGEPAECVTLSDADAAAQSQRIDLSLDVSHLGGKGDAMDLMIQLVAEGPA